MTTLNLQVSTGTDDGEENGSNVMDISASTVDLGGANFFAGFRFQSVAVGQAQVLTSAILQMYVFDTGQDNAYFNAHCEDIDDAPTLTTAASNLSNRTLTTASTNKAQSNVGVGWYTVDVTSAVQEVVDRGGWASGQDVMAILDAQASAFFRCRSYEGDSAEAAKLDIDFTAVGAAVPVLSEGGVHSLVFGGQVVK